MVSKEDIHIAVKSLHSGSMVEPNGLPNSFYQSLYDTSVDEIHLIVNNFIGKGCY